MFNFESLLTKARSGLDLINEGKRALAEVTDAINDGKVALSTHNLESLSAMLKAEVDESRAASADLQSAIADAKAKL